MSHAGLKKLAGGFQLQISTGAFYRLHIRSSVWLLSDQYNTSLEDAFRDPTFWLHCI